MNRNTLIFAGALGALVLLSAGCGNPATAPNPEVAPTKAVVGNPGTLKIGGKAVGGHPAGPDGVAKKP